MAGEIRDTEHLSPARSCELLAKLTALMGNVTEEVTIAELAYNKILSDEYAKEQTANRAKIQAQATGQYERLRHAKDAAYVVEKLTQSLKVIIRQQESEFRGVR